MEHTDGFGSLAEVWADGLLLSVCDSYSRPGEKCPPGLIEDGELGYTNDTAFSWEDARKGNPMHRQMLELLKGWRYTGLGRVEQIMPVIINFGGIRMEEGTWCTDEMLVGQYVAVPVDRLELRRANPPDWPEEIR